MYRVQDFNSLYVAMVYKLLFGDNRYIVETETTKEYIDFNCEIIDTSDIYLFNQFRISSLTYLLAENIWYASGSNDVNFIGNYASKWYDITDDGKTSNSAYGYIIKNKFNFDQIDKVIEILKKDKESRRAVIVINDANENVDTTKDEQCTMYLQFLIRDNKLLCFANMRSNDMYYGMPYDIPAFITIQRYIAGMLGIECGSYFHHATSLHIYKKDIDKLKMKTFGKFERKEKIILHMEKLYESFNAGDELSERLLKTALLNKDLLVPFCEANYIFERRKYEKDN